MTYSDVNTTTASGSSQNSAIDQNSEAARLQQQRLARFQAEPLEDGNRLVFLPYQSSRVDAAVRAHRERVSGKLAKS
ncbi:hypothetical protein CNYM01_10602 [Colletotrichum nymphaeae SA-01]|uniref:Uncharacterized protein n=1 Tax=Colletotrichum nymphaeae SA-01 TaxID=1460502 RepID=A0A135RYT9_9PEZI|nr:hypothetical protein CNYM01_10602 [Colletotrichum nymphaeae SA-01]